MFIQTESTPNPLTLKFIPGVPVMTAGTAFYTSPGSAEESPLAQALFNVPEVGAVYLGADFISVTRSENADWNVLKPALLAAIMDHFMAGRPVIEARSVAAAAVEESGEDAEIINQIKELIETRVRPSVAMDGGDIIYHSFRDGVVRLELHGACAGCPSSTATLKQGIENMLKHYIPEVVAVEAVA